MPDKLTITCPSCKSALTIANSPGIEQKVLKCPVCSYKATVGSYQNAAKNIRLQANDEPTDYGPVPPPIPQTMKPSFLKVNGATYNLQEGSNTIGRQAQTSVARIQIPGDPYMSRMQGTFYVEKTATGFCYRFEEMKAANHTTIRGNVLEEGDVVAVNPGDTLVMGETHVQLCSAAEAEQTEVKK